MKNDSETLDFVPFAPSSQSVKLVKTDKIRNSPVKRHTPIVSFTGKKRRKGLNLKAFFVFLSLLLILIGAFHFYAEKKLDPELSRLAEAQAKKYLLETVNRVVGELAEAGEVSYGNMVKTVRSKSGEVIYLEVDTKMLNGAKSKLVSAIDAALEKEKFFSLTVPIGSLTNVSLFSGLGFPVKVKLFPIGMTEGEIFTVLEDCGINQTRHLIQINVTASLLVVLPQKNVTVETEITLPLGERVLVGEVPEIYLDTLGAG